MAGLRLGVLEAGMCAVFAFPLRVGAAQLGVLDLFRARALRFERDE